MINCFQLKKGLALLGALIAGQTTFANAKVSITEIMQSNFGGVIDYYNEYPDSWVEIHNSSEEDIDLEGYSISETNDPGSAYTLPVSLVVPANGYALIFCDKENKKEHTDFRLNSDEPGTVYLWDDNGVFVDSLHYPEMISPEVSFGRLPDIPDSLSHFRISTPAAANNNTYTEQVLKKVDFSVEGGVKKEPFYLKLSLKGDYPKNTVIRYTLDGSEPTEKSYLFTDSLYIDDNTVLRAKPFSDSAISKISKTQSYIFDKDDKMPIISICCNNEYLYNSTIGIFADYTYYANKHPDNPPYRSWMGYENYYYDWRRPINIEFFSGDSLSSNFNQLSETRVSGNISRQEAKFKSMVVYANKRFETKHFKGALWPHLKPDVKKQKSMTIRSCAWDDDTYALRDMLSQTAIGRFAKYYDVDFQAQRNVQLYINGEFQQVMHLQERDNEDHIWANHNVTDIECLETNDGLNSPWIDLDEDIYPNYINFRDTYKYSETTYQEMADILDIDAFMNMLSTQAYFANTDFPYNNASIWYDKQGTKKWRWILKDMDGSIHDPKYNYYNFILREDPFDDYSWANTQEACEIFQKMFSFEKFYQPYIDRTCVLAGTAFSKNTLHFMLDSITENMSFALTASELTDYIEALESFYEWSEMRHSYYTYNIGKFFSLKDTVQLTIRSLQNDSMIFFNNNALIDNKFDGYFFENRYLYLTHNNKRDIYGLKSPDTNDITYLDLGSAIQTNDSSSTKWTISYTLEGERVYEHYMNEELRYKIPAGVQDVRITDGYEGDKHPTYLPSVSSHAPEKLTYMVYSIGGVFIGKFNHAEIREYKQKDEINIVVVTDENGKKLHTIKLKKG